MVDVPGMRHRRRSKRTKSRRLRAILATVFALGVLLAFAGLFRALDSQPNGASQTGVNLPAGSIPANAVHVSSSGPQRRPIYDYSVIPGGAWDEQQLTGAVRRDPVVAHHYRDVDPATMRPEILRSDRLVHVSYRVGDRVYWTKRKVRIRSGETILTNGQTEIRARCGNCISMAPLMPTSEDEPDESELDALTDIGPVLVSWNWPLGAPLAAGAPGANGDGGAGLIEPSQLLPLFPIGGAVFPGGAVAGDIPTDTLPVSSPPGGFPDPPPSGGTTPPFGVDPPFGGGAPDSDIPFNDPPLLPSLDGPGDPPGNSSTPPAFPPTLPPETTAVPEPATFLLLGSGIAGLVARHWRSKKN